MQRNSIYNNIQECTITVMNFDCLIQLVGKQPFFDLATAVQLSGEERAKLRTQLYRWAKAGKVVPLRRGMYTLTDRYRHVPLNQAALAGQLYRPSYLSGLWAVGFYDLIPEKVVTYTSVTTRVPRRFENAFGVFEYRHIKQDAFFGYRIVTMQGGKIILADPEKALLDVWHLGVGAWTEERMVEMRFQNGELIDPEKLMDYAKTFESPRLERAAGVWIELFGAEAEGTVEL